MYPSECIEFFFFNDPATTKLYTLSLHDALPISPNSLMMTAVWLSAASLSSRLSRVVLPRSEEHTSELQSPVHLVCRLLLEKKKERERIRRVRKENPEGHEDYL